MNEFVSNILQQVAIWSVPFIIPVLCGVITLGVLKFLVWRKSDVDTMKLHLELVRDIFGKSLGPKADAVFAVWVEGLDRIKDGDLSHDDMVTELLQFVKAALYGQDISLTPEETETVESATEKSVEMACVKKSSTTQAVKIMMNDVKIVKLNDKE